MSKYRQTLKAARTEHIRKLIDNDQNNPRFLFSTVARLTNKQMSPDLNIPSQFNSNDFMNFFTDKIDNIRNTITNVDSTASSTSASFIAPKEKRSGYYRSNYYRSQGTEVTIVTGAFPFELSRDITENFSVMGTLFSPAVREAMGSLYQLHSEVEFPSITALVGRAHS